MHTYPPKPDTSTTIKQGKRGKTRESTEKGAGGGCLHVTMSPNLSFDQDSGMSNVGSGTPARQMADTRLRRDEAK